MNSLGKLEKPITTLTLTGTITAGSAPDVGNATLAGKNGADITITTVSDMLLGVAGQPLALTGRNVSLNTVGTAGPNNTPGITGNLTQTPQSVITADTLAGSLTPNAANTSLPAAALPGANQVATLGNFSAPGGFSVTDARNLTIAGSVTTNVTTPPLNAVTIVAKDGTGTPSATEAGQAGVGHLTVASTGRVTGNTVSLTGTDIVVGGQVGACELPGTTTGGTVLLTATGSPATPATIVVNDGVVGGQVAVTLAAANGVSVNGGIVDAGTSSTTGTVNIGTGLVQTGGKVFADTVNVVGGATMTGGLLHANHLTGAITFNSGDFYDGDPLTVALGPSVTGQIATRGTLTATGAGSVTTSANIYAGRGATLTVNGDVTQTAGQIAAGNDLTVLAKGVISQTGGDLLAGGNLLLSGAGNGSPAAFAGRLAGNGIQVLEPNTPVSFSPTTIAGAATVQVALLNDPECPGCVPTGLGTSVVTASAAPGPYRPATLRLDGAALTLGSPIAADTVELHSVGNTAELAGGSLTAGFLSGTAGYAYDAASYGLNTLPTAQQRPAYTPLLISGTPTDVGGTVTLAQSVDNLPVNNIAQINGYQVRGGTAHNGLTLQDAPGPQVDSAGKLETPAALTLTGTITAGSAPDVTNATLAGQNGADIAITTRSDLLLGAAGQPLALTGRNVSLNTLGTAGPNNTPGITGTLTETLQSVITADTLRGSLAPNAANTPVPAATLPGANQVATLTSFSAPGGFSMTDARNLAITGTVTALASGPVGIVAKDGTGTPSATEAGQAGIGHLTIASTGVVTGNTVSLTGTDIVVGGQVGACELPGTASGGTVLLTATGTPSASTLGIVTPATITVNDGVVGGQASVMLAAAGGVSVNGGIVDAGTSSTTGAVNIGTGLALTGGKVFADTVNVVGGATMTGGLLHANHLTGSISFTGGGDLYDGDPLTVALGPLVTGQIATRGTLTATGAGSVTTSANIYAGKGATLTVNGDVTQTAGQIAAGNDLTVLAKGVISQTGGDLLAGGNLLLSGAGNGSPAAFAGRLAGNGIQVLEPNTPVSFSPTTIAGAATVQVALLNDPECPGCVPTGLGTSVVTASAAPGPYRPATLRLDGAALTLGSPIAADTAELHSVGSTAELPGGSLAADSLSGTAGYGYTAASYGLNVLPTAQQSPAYAPLLTAGTPSDVGGTVTLAQAANNVALISGYQVRGDTAHNGLTLQDAPGPQVNALGGTDTPTALTLTGTITAGSAPYVSTTALAGQNGADITVRTTGDLFLGTTVANQADVRLTGRGVTLLSGGNQTETGGSAIIAATLTGNSPNTGLPGGNQVATLGGFTAPGGFQLNDMTGLSIAGPVSAANGTVAITAGATTVQAPAASGPATIVGANVTLDTGSLTVNGNIGALSTGDGMTGTVKITAGGPVTLNDGAVIGGQTSVTVKAGAIAQQGSSLVNGPSVTLDGAFTQSDGRVVGSSVTVTGPLTQTGGTIWSGNDFTATAPTVGGTIGSAGNVALSGVTAVSGTIASDKSVNLTGPAGTTLQLSGTVTAAIDLTIQGSGITQSAGQLAAGGSAFLTASDGAASQTGGTLAAGTVKVVAPGENSFATAVQPVLSGAVGSPVPALFAIPGAVISADPGIPGVLTATLGSARPATVDLEGGTLTIANPNRIAGDSVILKSTGTTTVAGVIDAGVLSGSAGDATLNNANNTIVRLGPYSVNGSLVVVDSAPGLTIAGQVAAGAVTVSLPNGGLTIGDATSPGSVLAGTAVTLTTLGPITEAAGSVLLAGTLTGSATGGVALPGQNAVNSIGPFAAPAGFNLNDAASLIVSGPINASGPVALNAPGLTIAGTAGSINSGASVALTATGPLMQAGTVIAATTVTASSPGQASTFSGMTTAGTAITIDAGSGTASLSGTEKAPQFNVTATTVNLKDGFINVSGVPQPAGTTAANLPDFGTGNPGVYFQTTNFTQTGNTAITPINPTPGAPDATAVIDPLPNTSAVTVKFQTLNGPNTDLVIRLGTGTATGGPLTLRNLFITYSGTGTSTVNNLIGTIDGLPGIVAAGAARIADMPNRNYQINGCAISSVNCVVLQPTLVPVGNPLKELSLNFFREQDERFELMVPNITDQGL